MSDLREKILQELREEVEKTNEKIKNQKDEISTAMYAKSTIPGGPFATTARNSCDKAADKARKRIRSLEYSCTWYKEILEKYK